MSDIDTDLEYLDELSAAPPIIPYEGKRRGQSKQIKYQGSGWKYYLAVKPKLRDWWEEFNGTLGKDTSPKFKSIKSFIQSRTKNKSQQEWLYQMMGPKPNEDSKLEVPWLGDWSKRRKNGYWNTEDGFEYRRLVKLINKNIDATEAIRQCAPFVIQDLIRIGRLQQKIDDKFNGDPFLNGHPLSHGNKNRFKMFVKMHDTLIKLKRSLIQDWMMINGIDPKAPHQMHDMALLAQLSGGIGASAALAGFNSGQRQLSGNLPDGVVATSDGGVVISKDALLVASHLTKHAKDWNKALPLELNGDELIEKKDRSEKSNGKHREKSLQ